MEYTDQATILENQRREDEYIKAQIKAARQEAAAQQARDDEITRRMLNRSRGPAPMSATDQNLQSLINRGGLLAPAFDETGNVITTPNVTAPTVDQSNIPVFEDIVVTPERQYFEYRDAPERPGVNYVDRGNIDPSPVMTTGIGLLGPIAEKVMQKRFSPNELQGVPSGGSNIRTDGRVTDGTILSQQPYSGVVTNQMVPTAPVMGAVPMPQRQQIDPTQMNAGPAINLNAAPNMPPPNIQRPNIFADAPSAGSNIGNLERLAKAGSLSTQFGGAAAFQDEVVDQDRNLKAGNAVLSEYARTGAADPNIARALSDALEDSKKDPSDPYKWQNFFASAAIAFDNLRMPSMRNPALVKMMADRIQFNRTLVKSARSADSIEAIGTPKAQMLAKAVRDGTLTVKDAFTALYKNKSQFQDMLDLMQNNPAEFAKIAPYITPGYGEGNAAILKEVIKQKTAVSTAADASKRVFDGIDRILRVIDDFKSAGYETGPWAETKKSIIQSLNSYGLNFNEKFLDKATSLEAASNLLVAEQLRLNKGPQTDFDALFTQSFIPSLGLTNAANQEIISYMRSVSLADMLINQAAQDVKISQVNPNQSLEEVYRINALKNDKDFAKVVKVRDASNGQQAKFSTFESFVTAYRDADSNAAAIDIIEAWMQTVANARKSLKSKAL